ncbi:MAG: hypothetical protein J6Q84_02225 [Kiritimatiellae bacterium]|nr:hypothetical protein [Kiritimatiellia bacterium]
MRKAFTLMEVNLAILIMTGGVLSILGLYSLGYRETDQSREDVQSAMFADAVISPLVRVLSSPNVRWQAFSDLQNYPAEGWRAYLTGNEDPEDIFEKVCEAAAKEGSNKTGSGGVFSAAKWPAGFDDLKAGLVVEHKLGSAIVKIGFRAAKKSDDLLAMPLYYTEVRFQGESSVSTSNQE